MAGTGTQTETPALDSELEPFASAATLFDDDLGGILGDNDELDLLTTGWTPVGTSSDVADVADMPGVTCATAVAASAAISAAEPCASEPPPLLSQPQTQPNRSLHVKAVLSVDASRKPHTRTQTAVPAIAPLPPTHAAVPFSLAPVSTAALLPATTSVATTHAVGGGFVTVRGESPLIRAAVTGRAHHTETPAMAARREKQMEKALARKRGNNTHTRRCRKKVNDKFDELLSILPPPDDPKEQPVKHKAQILAYSIQRIREISSRNHYLELMLAMSSRPALNRWIDSVVSRSTTLTQALQPFMELLCTTREWKYAELWMPSEADAPEVVAFGSSGGRKLLATASGTATTSSSSSASSSSASSSASVREKDGQIIACSPAVSAVSAETPLTADAVHDENATVPASPTSHLGVSHCATSIAHPLQTGVSAADAVTDDADSSCNNARVGTASPSANLARTSDDTPDAPPAPPPRLQYVSSSMPKSLPAELAERLSLYRERSREYEFEPRAGVPGRVYLSKLPEWLPWLTDPIAFPRSPHAQNYDVKVTFAVPVVIDGKVAMVVEFYDTVARDYDPEVLSVAGDIAGLIGRAFQAKMGESNDLILCDDPPPPSYSDAPLGDVP